MKATMTRKAKTLSYGDPVYSTLHGRLVRFVRWEGVYAQVMDRDTLRHEPDLVHAAQVLTGPDAYAADADDVTELGM